MKDWGRHGEAVTRLAAMIGAAQYAALLRPTGYEFFRGDGSTVTIREHSLGHTKDGLGPHFNVEVGPGNPLQEERTTMSSLVHPRGQPFFVVQSGIVTWEDLEPITDWRRKTVSIVSKTLPVAVALLWAVVASRPQQVDRVFRYYLAPISPSITAMQKRRLATGLKTDPPGFAETTLSITDTHACVTSTLRDPSAVDPGFLTAYRRCALVELADSPLPGAELLQEACRTITDLGAAGIGTLLATIESSALLRILELESYAVVQLIGASEVVDPAIRCLVDRGIRRFQDVRALPHEIAGLRE